MPQFHPQLQRSAVEQAAQSNNMPSIDTYINKRYFMLFLVFRHKVTNNIYNFATF